MKSFAACTAREKCIEVLRWFGVVPAAVLAGMVPRYIASLLMSPALALPPGAPPVPVSDFQRYYLPHLIGIIMAAGFVIVGAKVAPRWRVPVAAVLAVLWMAFSYGIHVRPHASYELRYWRAFIVATVAALAATAYVWYSEKGQSTSK